LIIVGAAMMVGAGLGANSEDEGDLLDIEHPYEEPTSTDKLASKALLDVATKLYKDSNGSDPEFYKKIFEGLPENKMGADDRQRLAQQYNEINILANQKAMEQAGQAFGEDIKDAVARGVYTPAQADKLKIKNEAEVRAMMSILNKRWQSTEIADARNMWLGDQKSKAGGVGLMANVRAKNQAMFNMTVDSGLRSALRRAGDEQDFQSKQMWANEKALQETRAAKYQFWTNMFFPGGGGGGGMKHEKPDEANKNVLDSSGRGMRYSSNTGAYYWGAGAESYQGY
jgi:hypothetical protein